MLNLPRQTLEKVRSYLLKQQRQINEQIKSKDSEDPVLADLAAGSTEPGTDSWQADVHSRLQAVKGDLIELSRKIATSLTKLKKGTYGMCEKCGKQIEADRLEVMPTATLCISCSKKKG